MQNCSFYKETEERAEFWWIHAVGCFLGPAKRHQWQDVHHIADILNTGRYILPPIPEDLDTVTPTRGGGGETRQGTSRTSGDSATGVPITATSASRGGREGVAGNVDVFLKPSFFFSFR